MEPELAKATDKKNAIDLVKLNQAELARDGHDVEELLGDPLKQAEITDLQKLLYGKAQLVRVQEEVYQFRKQMPRYRELREQVDSLLEGAKRYSKLAEKVITVHNFEKLYAAYSSDS